ncbi:MAG: LysR family transcriptional regulator [Pseudomonadota bacterium]
MNIRFLESFIWLTRLKNFRETAEKLNTTQPNISSRIGSLEDQLRTQLYVRGAKEFELTGAGRRLVEYAEKIVDLFGEMQTAMAVEGSDQPVLRVGILELITMSWLRDFIDLIAAADANFEIDMVTDTSAVLIDMLRKDELDLAFSWGPAHEPNVANDYICTYAMAWLGQPKFLPHDGELDVVDLLKLPIIPQRPNSSPDLTVKEYFASFGLPNTPSSNARVTVSNFSIATASQLIRDGFGVMAMVPMMLSDAIADGGVVVLPVKQSLPPTHLTACYRSPGARLGVGVLVDLAKEAAAACAKKSNPSHFWI